MHPMLGRQQDSASSAETGDTGISFFLASILDHDRKGLRNLRHRSGKEKGREPPSKQETRLL